MENVPFGALTVAYAAHILEEGKKIKKNTISAKDQE